MTSAAAPSPIASPDAQAAPDAAKERARQAAQSFEAFFLFQLLEHMSAGLKTDGPFAGGFAEAAWRSQLNEQYAGIIAKRGGIGLADHLFREILRLQEAQ
jgi:Rod binding domain-containing protein